MTIDPVLTLAQWFSPAFPVGSFSYSHGLEWSIDTGDVCDAATTAAWIEDVLEHGSGRSDATFLAAAYHADDPAAVNDLAVAFAPSRERAFEAREQGRAFATAVGGVWGKMPDGLVYPVAVGVAARQHDLPLRLCSAMYLQAFVGTLAAVAMRRVPLGQTDGQRIIRDLTPLCHRLAEETEQGDLETVSGAALLTDIASMKHETQYSRMFRT